MLLAAGDEGVRLLDLENPDAVHRLKERGVAAVAFGAKGAAARASPSARSGVGSGAMMLTVRTGTEGRTIELTGRVAGVVQRILNAGGRGCPASLLPGDVENTLAHFGIRLARAGERSRERVMIVNATMVSAP